MNRQGIFLPLVVLAMLGLAACGGSTAGTGSAVATTGDNQPSSGGGGSSSSPLHSGPSLASIDPCSLLTSSDLSQFQLTQTDAGTALGARSCAWKNATANGGNGYAIGFDIRDSQGLADISTDNVTISNDPIGGHPGKQSKGIGGGIGCIVTIGVASSSRVDVNSFGSTDANGSCVLANQFAKLIEPKLPPASN